MSRRSIRARLNPEALEHRLAPATFSVLNADDAGPGSLRQAILDANAAAGPDDIDFDPGFFNAGSPQTINLVAASGQLTISDDLIINGPGPAVVTVSGGGSVRPFNVDNAPAATQINVTLSGMTVTGGNGNNGGGTPAARDGGAIRTTDEILTLDSIVVSGNAANPANDGGGITATSTAFITIRNSTISGNTARRGGGIYFFSGGGLLMENSTVSGNTATESNGGSAGIGGGGIYFVGTVAGGGFTIRNCTIAGNAAANSGGGLVFRNLGGTALIQNSTITGNTANTTSALPGEGGGGIAVSSGGAASILAIESSIVSGNNATAANGRSDIAMIAAAGGSISYSAIGDADGFTITGAANLPFGSALNLLPLATYGGPTESVGLGLDSLAVDAGSNPAMLTTDQRGAGFARELGAAADIGAVEGVIDIPSASGGPFADVTAAGGVNYTFDVTYSGATPIDVSTLDNNDIRVTGPNGFSQLAEFVSVNPAGNGSPRIATYSLTAPGGTFGDEDNGLYSISLQSGEVANINAGAAPFAVIGAVRVAIAQTLTVTNLNDSGPGSLRQAILESNATDNLSDTIVFQAGLTGTIHLDPAVGQLSITDGVTIIGPGADVVTVSGDGGVRIFNIDGPARVIDVAISGLTVTGGNGSSGGPTPGLSDGGCIRITDERVTLDRTVVTGCDSGTNDGGGIAVTATAFITIRNSTISGNTARRGGGVYFFSGGSLLMENSTISGNTSTDSLSVGNGGGGVYFFGVIAAGGFTIRNSTIAGNTAAGTGGGLVLRFLTGTALIQNSTFTGNAANTAGTTPGEGGGGIALPSSPSNPILIMENTIVSGNTSGNGSDDMAVIAEATVNATYSAIGDGDGFTLSASSSANLPFGSVLDLQSLADNGGPTRTIELGAGSLAIDAGPTAVPGVSFDQRGAPFTRIRGAASDIGAFEVQAGAAAPTVIAVTVNNAATQRSRVTTIDVTFSAEVAFAGPPAAAFTMTRNGGGAVNFTATANIVGGVTVVTLNAFTGAETESGSLRDGRYTLTALASQISAGIFALDGDGNGIGGDDFTFGDPDGLFRFYGDMNGDRRVDIADFGFFSLAYLTQLNYNPALDFNNDGRIDIADFGQFSVRYFTTLP